MQMFRARFKRDIVTEFLPPARSGKIQKAIVLCDGMPSIPRKQPLAEFLSEKGYWVFYPRYRGAWESGGDPCVTRPTGEEGDCQLPGGGLGDSSARGEERDFECQLLRIYSRGVRDWISAVREKLEETAWGKVL